MKPLLASLLVVTLALPACAPVGSGPQLIISANENRLDLAYGAMKVFGDPAPDSLTVLDLSCLPPKVTHIDGIANIHVDEASVMDILGVEAESPVLVR